MSKSEIVKKMNEIASDIGDIVDANIKSDTPVKLNELL
jgi:hypothetical protein